MSEHTPVDLPVSLGSHVPTREALAQIAAHVEKLALTARRVGDTLPLDASVADALRALERGAD